MQSHINQQIREHLDHPAKKKEIEKQLKKKMKKILIEQLDLKQILKEVALDEQQIKEVVSGQLIDNAIDEELSQKV